jgi:ribosomal protein L7/L12
MKFSMLGWVVTIKKDEPSLAQQIMSVVNENDWRPNKIRMVVALRTLDKSLGLKEAHDTVTKLIEEGELVPSSWGE